MEQLRELLEGEWSYTRSERIQSLARFSDDSVMKQMLQDYKTLADTIDDAWHPALGALSLLATLPYTVTAASLIAAVAAVLGPLAPVGIVCDHVEKKYGEVAGLAAGLGTLVAEAGTAYGILYGITQDPKSAGLMLAGYGAAAITAMVSGAIIAMGDTDESVTTKVFGPVAKSVQSLLSPLYKRRLAEKKQQLLEYQAG